MKWCYLAMLLLGMAALMWLVFSVHHINPVAPPVIGWALGTLWASTLRRK